MILWLQNRLHSTLPLRTKLVKIYSTFTWHIFFELLIFFWLTVFWTCMMYKKSNSFVYIFVDICHFFQITRSGSAYKAKNWLTLSHKQCFWNSRFLDICRCAFKHRLIFWWRIPLNFVCLLIFLWLLNTISYRPVSIDINGQPVSTDYGTVTIIIFSWFILTL